MTPDADLPPIGEPTASASVADLLIEISELLTPCRLAAVELRDQLIRDGFNPFVAEQFASAYLFHFMNYILQRSTV